jgi:CRP/FNR family cyclic AMP-dependent transcriptional regulator
MDTARSALGEARDADAIDPALLALLKRVPLFVGLTPQQLRRVVALGRLKRFRAGTPIVRLGARGNSFHVILEGRAFVVRENGRPLSLAAGDFFGELALIDDAPRSADVIAAEDVLAFTIGRPGFTRLLRSEAAFTYVILRTLANRLRADQGSPVWQLGNVSTPDPADG